MGKNKYFVPKLEDFSQIPLVMGLCTGGMGFSPTTGPCTPGTEATMGCGGGTNVMELSCTETGALAGTCTNHGTNAGTCSSDGSYPYS